MFLLSRKRPSTAIKKFYSTIITRSLQMWDERYAMDEYAYGKEPNDYLKERLPQLPKNAKCLMLADGEGRNGVYVASLGYQVLSIDMSVKGLEKAKRLAKELNVQLETQVVDLADYNFPTNHFDLITGIYCHLPPPIRQRMLEQIPKALKHGGYFLLECYTPDQLQYGTGGPPSPQAMYTAELLREQFHEKLVILENAEKVRRVKEGLYHTGVGAVVQFLGQKAVYGVDGES